MSNKAQKRGLVPKLRFPAFREAGEWKEETLNQITTAIFDGTHQTPTYTEDGIPFFSVENIVSGKSNKFISRDDYLDATIKNRPEKGDVLITRIGNIGFSTVVDWSYEFSIYVTLAVIKKDNRFNSGYLHGYIQSPQYQAEIQSKSLLNAVPCKINMDELRKTIVLLPSPEEQKKIADCLSSLDERIILEAQKLDTLKTHKKGLMQQLFPAEGETLPKLRFPEFRDAGEWEIKPLAKVCNVLQGYGFPEVLQGKNEGKYPFCKVSDISRAVAENGGLLAEATNYVGDDELLKLRAKLIPKDATVFAKIGEALRLNRRAYVQKECLIDNNATGLKAIDGVADDYFVYLLSQLIDLDEHCGGAVPSVNKSTLEEIEVVVPGTDEQKRIAASLSSLDDLITAQTQKLAALKTHKRGLMHQLFPSADEVTG